jgi:glycine betaine/proline transport system substrate-binding protein
LDKNPAARRFFELAVIPINDVSAENSLINNGEKSERDIKRHAQEWIKKNRSEFDGWIKEALEAAQ